MLDYAYILTNVLGVLDSPYYECTSYPTEDTSAGCSDVIETDGRYIEDVLCISDQEGVLERIAMFAGTFTEWEAKTRYIKNFQLGIWQLDMGLKLAEEFVAYEQKTNLFK